MIKGFDNQGMKSLIITDNQAFHHVSPYFSNPHDDSPDQTVNRIKIECHLPLLYTTHHPGLPLTIPTGQKKNLVENLSSILMRRVMTPKSRGERDSAAQKRPPVRLSDTFRVKKNSSTPVTSDTTTEKGGPDRNRCDVTMRHKSEPQQHKDMSNHRFSINQTSGSKENQFLTSLMTYTWRQDRVSL